MLHLSPAKRIHLTEDLWDSIAAHPEQVEILPKQFAEIERRLAELDENPETGESWEQVKARLLALQT